MIYAQEPDSVDIYGLETMPFVLQNERPATVRQHRAGLTFNRLATGGDCMAHAANNAPIDSAQPYQDPLIVNARLVNLAAEIERNLAVRKAMRPARSAAALKGWETRNDR